MRASILIRNYNGRDLLANLLPGLTGVVAKRGEGDEVLVVDDGSTDGSPAFIEQRFPGIRLVRLSPNSGNSILPVNAGVDAASCDVVICLDSDVLVDSDFITPMLRHFRDDNVFAVCPRIVNPGYGDTVESVNYPLFRRGRLVGMVPGMERGAVLPGYPTEVWYAPGSGAGYHRARFLALGGLDILYRPFYYEDLDICQRAWRRGWRTLYEPRAVTYHLKHVTTKKSILRPVDFQIYRTKNILLFTWKNLLDRPLMRRHLAWSGLYLARALLVADRVYLAAFLMAARQMREALAARRREQEEMQVDDRRIFSRLSALHSNGYGGNGVPGTVEPWNRTSCPFGPPRIMKINKNYFWNKRTSMIRRLKGRLRPLFYRYFEYTHLVRAFEWAVIRRWLKPISGEIILDIGCGHGHFVRRLWKPGLRILGIDLNENGIGIAQRYNKPDGCGFMRADAMALPFRSERFDRVMSVCSFEHFSDDDWAIREANRVLKNQGTLVLSVDSFSYPGISASYRERCREKHAVCRFYTNGVLRGKLERAGFSILNERCVLSSPLAGLGYRLGTFFRWAGIDFMDPILFILLFPLSFLFEHILGLRLKGKGYILVMEAQKVAVPS